MTRDPAGPGRAKDVLVVLFDGVQSLDVTGPVEVFTGAAHLVTAPGPGAYRVRTASLDGAPVRTSSGLSLAPDLALDDAPVPHTLLVPGGEGTRACEARLVGWLRAHAPRAPRLVSVCTGALALAEAGLLDGRTVATHWMYADELRRRHPRVRVDERSLYVDDGDVLTSAGTAAAIDLCLHIVRRDYGTAAAGEVGRRMVVAPHREGGQAQYVPPRQAALPRSAEGAAEGLAPVLDWAVERLHEPLTMGQLASRAGTSTRTFGRWFAREVGTTPLKWLNQQRVARARELLETTDLPVDSVAQRC
ncbi:DJ-1/PfpI family protein, partial [Streptomyces daliensis]|nr:DJ-1/PfpI family protein [Streptomyces daliensis]